MGSPAFDPLNERKRCQMSVENLKMINARGSNFFHRLITVDEAWLHQFEAETKMQSKQWCRRKENPSSINEQSYGHRVFDH